jgi:hypothetical protein
LLAVEHVELAIALIPGVLVIVMNVVYAATAYPFGGSRMSSTGGCLWRSGWVC